MRLKPNPSRVLAIALILTAFLLSSCGDDSAGPGQPQIVGTLIDYSACGGYVTAKTVAGVTSDQTAAAWAWDGQGTLDLRHLNGAFNCCPQISCKITVKENVITVTEMDEGLCDCLCLTDVDYKITGLPAGPYLVKFEELYLLESDQKLEFPLILGTVAKCDTVYVTRNHYPWMPPVISAGTVTDFSECGGFLSARTVIELPSDSSCVVWDYDDTHTLKLHHLNVIFNCGMYDVSTIVFVDTGAIWIEERPLINPMHCLCPFDIEIEIPDVSPEYYGVMITHSNWDGEKWVPSGDSTRFSIDLINEPSGYHCYDEVEP